MSGQLESRHFYRTRDRVQHLDGMMGTVLEGHALYALLQWDDGRSQEVDQFDPRIAVTDRSEAV